MSGKVESFDYRKYMRRKYMYILGQNRSVKLTAETLMELANLSLKLVPPLDE